MYIIPSQDEKKFIQLNNGDLSGNIFVTRNIDFRRRGYLRLSRAVVAYMAKSDDSNFDSCDNMFASSSETFFISKKIFSKGPLGVDTLNSRSGDTNAPSPGVEEGGCYFNDTEVVSDGTNIKYRSASTTWTSVASAASSSLQPTSLCAWPGANTLVVGNNNKVKFVNTSWTVNATVLTLPSEYKVTGVAANGLTLFIATRHEGNGRAQLFTVTTIKSSADASFPIGSFEIFSIQPYGSSVVLLNSRGQLLFFNGGGFDELAHFPALNSRNEWADSSNDHSKVSTNGMAVDGERVYIRYDSSYETGETRYDPYFPGGVACYDPEVGLHHFCSPSFTKAFDEAFTTSDVDTSTDQITVAATAPVTGTPCVYVPFTTPLVGGLSEGVLYYIIKVDSTHVKLATSYANALAGTAINLTSTGNSFQKLVYFNVKDYGWSYAENRGAIAVLTNSLLDSVYGDRFAFTGNVFDNSADSTVGCIQNPFLANRGYFITPRLLSSGIEEIYNALMIKFRPLKDVDSIVIKYRTREKDGFPLGLKTTDTANYIGTWSSTTVFTSTRDLSTVQAGDEIEIVAGVGSGFTAHVSSIEYSGGTYTVTLDEWFIFAVASDKMYFVADNWKKLATITSSSENADKGWFYQPIEEGTDKFIQFKIELRGLDTTIEELQVGNKSQIAMN